MAKRAHIGKKIAFLLLAASIMVTSTSCGRQRAAQPPDLHDGGNPAGSRSGALSGSNANILSDGRAQGSPTTSDSTTVVPLTTKDGKQYVDANRLITALQYNAIWNQDEGSYEFGDNDVAYSVKPNTTEGAREGDTVHLADQSVFINNSVYLPLSAVDTLLKGDIQYEVKGSDLVLHAIGDGPGLPDMNADTAPGDDPSLDFADDPNDPYKDAATGAEVPSMSEAVVEEDGSVPALKNINMSALINRAKMYLGVRYQFGAGPYPRTGKFDCSSYTQYIFGKFGVHLARLARQQARQGVYVSRKNLRVGDLVFFYVPGRFKSNKTVGHVGIYMGRGYMINANTAPKNGVQITNINRPYWKRVYLYAKRVAY